MENWKTDLFTDLVKVCENIENKVDNCGGLVKRIKWEVFVVYFIEIYNETNLVILDMNEKIIL